jgi:hypothetical protein
MWMLLTVGDRFGLRTVSNPPMGTPIERGGARILPGYAVTFRVVVVSPACLVQPRRPALDDAVGKSGPPITCKATDPFGTWSGIAKGHQLGRLVGSTLVPPWSR